MANWLTVIFRLILLPAPWVSKELPFKFFWSFFIYFITLQKNYNWKWLKFLWIEINKFVLINNWWRVFDVFFSGKEIIRGKCTHLQYYSGKSFKVTIHIISIFDSFLSHSITQTLLQIIILSVMALHFYWINLLKLLIEQKVCQFSTTRFYHFAKSWNLSSNVTLSLILLSEEITSKIVDKLWKIRLFFCQIKN